jgi:hypothetical protein
MNTVIMLTIVAGQVLAQATFKDLDTCLETRAKVMTQVVSTESVSVTCTVKTDNSSIERNQSAKFLKMFADTLNNMSNMQSTDKTK